MDAARVVKDGYEIALVRRANAVSSAAHRRVLEGLRAMANEREIEAVFRAHCMAAGAHRQAYPVIAGSGANAGVLHYFANNEPLAGRQLVCLDAGAEWHCYASDVTRTFPVSGAFSPEAAAVYAVVERMQAECIARVRPGAEFRALQDHAMALAVDGLLALGILRAGSAADILAAGTAAAFFPTPRPPRRPRGPRRRPPVRRPRRPRARHPLGRLPLRREAQVDDAPLRPRAPRHAHRGATEAGARHDHHHRAGHVSAQFPTFQLPPPRELLP